MAKQKKTENDRAFSVVAIGGATGALEALKEFVYALGSHTGMAYVYLQHPTPDFDRRTVDELIEKAKISILEVEDGMPLEPDFFYMVTPGQEAVIENNKFKLVKSVDGQDFLPINRLFHSVAQNYTELSVGILLSGAEGDGSQGMTAIKVAGGVTFAQNETALFHSMPKTAIALGAVDLVLPPEGIAEELKSLSKQKQAYLEALQDLDGDNIPNQSEELQQILQLVQKTSKADFSQYKLSTIKRRIVRRVVLHKLHTLPDYIQYLKNNPGEVTQLFNDLLINVTAFFRDAELMDYLKVTLLPEIIKNKKHNEPIRVWVPACSTGQEVYSIAIILVEALGEQYTHLPIQMFATDLSEIAINKARLGVYTKDEVQDVSPKRLQRFFTKADGNYRIIKSIRDLCVFATHDIVKDPPFSRVDIVSCCNLMIYLNNGLQKKLLSTFHYALNPNGYLIVGKSETVGSSANLFTQIDKRVKIFAKRKDASPKAMFDIHYPNNGDKLVPERLKLPQKPKTDEYDLEKEVDSLLLRRFTPASVLIDSSLDILSFRGSTGLYLEPTPGKASLNLLKMARPGLGFELRNTVHKAVKTGEAVKRSGMEITLDGKTHYIDLEVIPILNEGESSYYLVAFQPGLPPQETEIAVVKDKKVKQLEAELAALREDMRSIVEGQEAALEELQSANEEIISSNEELQSINEELETSKEEVESSNEELFTINQELHIRNEQLTESQDYAEAVFATIREALVILDKNLRVKTANFIFYKTFNLREEHAHGRLLYDLNNKQWDFPELRQLLEEKLQESAYIHGFEVLRNFSGIGEKNLVLNVRRVNQRIHGDQLILLAIEDITEHRRAQKIIAEREIWFRNLADNAPIMIWVTDKEKKGTFFNKAWLEFRSDTLEEAIQKGWTDGVHPDDLPKTIKVFDESFAEKLPFELKYRVKHHDKEYVWLHNKAKPNFTPEGLFMGYIGSCVTINTPEGH